MRYTFTAVYIEGHDGWIVAYVEELGGVIAQGRTMKSCDRHLRDAALAMMHVNKLDNRRNARGMKRIARREIEVKMPRRLKIRRVKR